MRRAAARRPPLSPSPFPCVLPIPPLLAALAAASERATSLARSPTTGLLPMCEEKCIAGTGLDPYRGAKAMRAHFSPFVRSSFHLWAMHRDEFV